MRTYPLEIENAGSDTYIVMSRGHHDPHVFMAKVREDGYPWPLGMPTHHWVKKVPCNTGEYDFLYVFVQKGTRGAFPATYSHEAHHDETYEALCAAVKEAATPQKEEK